MFRLSGPPGDHHFVTPDVYRICFERVRRRTRHHLPVQVIKPVMTSAPNLVAGLFILHSAVQMRADRGKCAPLRLGGADQQYRETAELHDLARVRFQILYLSGADLVDRGLRNVRRVHEFECRIKE